MFVFILVTSAARAPQDVDPYVYMIPPLGPHYSTTWAEQDRMAGYTPEDVAKAYTAPGAFRATDWVGQGVGRASARVTYGAGWA